MKKSVKEYRPHNLKPVKRIELSEKNMKLRSVLAILFLAIGAVALGLGVSSLFSSDPGWAVINANSSELNCSGEFVFNYCLGMSGKSATTEKRSVTEVYSKAVASAYKIFDEYQAFEGVGNIYTVNSNLNLQTEVAPELYEALELVCSYNDRHLFLAPIYYEYASYFFGPIDYIMNDDCDPYTNEEVAAGLAKLAEFASDKGHVSLELLGNNTVKLNVSEEYLAYATEHEITNFIGFSWFGNAFVIDYLANTLISSGYCYGNITSTDGFVRNLDNISGQTYVLNQFDIEGTDVYISSKMNYSTPAALVTLRAFPVVTSAEKTFYVKADGGIITPYIDITDGLYRSATDSITLYSESEKGCAEILLSAIDIYVSERLDVNSIKELAVKGIHSVWCDGTVVKYTEKNLALEAISYEEKAYTKAYVFD